MGEKKVGIGELLESLSYQSNGWTAQAHSILTALAPLLEKHTPEEIVRLVESLPVTADGVRVGPLGAVYGPTTGRRYIANDLIDCQQDRNFGEDDEHPDNSEVPRIREWLVLPISDCYSTPEAAEQAKRETPDV